MSEPALLADHLDEQTDSILAVWRATVERVGDVPEAEELSYKEFLDHVPALLDRVAERLRGLPADAGALGKKHGEHRWRQGYDIGQIVNEFTHLRAALSRSTLEYARERQWELGRLQAALEAIDEVLAEATAESVRQFQQDSREETETALAEVKTRQRAATLAEAIAHAEQTKLRTILRSLPAAVWVVDASGTIVGANDVADRLHEALDPHYVGRVNVHALGPRYRLSRPDGTPYASDDLPLCRALRGETVNQEEMIWEFPDRSLALLFNAAPLLNSEGHLEGAVGVAQDVTELEKQRERAEEASRHKTRLLAALSHDVRTPLNAVVLAAHLLELHLDGEPDAEVQECLRMIRQSVGNVLDLLGDLLNLSKIDAGAVLAEVTTFALEPVLAECLASIESQARMKGLEIGLERGNLAASGLDTDRAKFKQIIGNFLSNAVRYTEQGSIQLRAEHRDGRVRIAVVDTGAGIDPKDQGRIFDEYAMLEQPRRSAGSEGTGLGLTICRRLAGLLGGEITLVSAPGQGSTFTLVLPEAVLTAGPFESGPGAPSAPQRTETGPIVVAEDHDESRQTLAKVLRRMGYRVLEASNGRDALDLIEAERPLAVLMDVNMPIMNGVDAILTLRADARFRDLPIFALTGDVTPDNQHRIGEAGVNGYLEKPVTWELLNQALASIGRPAAG